MARFVLVHGAFTGAWIWAPLAKRLRAAGHTVDVFDLPGLGDDATPPGDVSLDSCAARLGEVLATSVEPAIVAGNSMGGVIATQAAARYPHRVAALVYVTAFVPRDGQSLLDLAHLPEGADDQVQANIIIEPPVATMPPAASRSALYGSCSDVDAAWAISKQRPQPHRTVRCAGVNPGWGSRRHQPLLCPMREGSRDYRGVAAADDRRERDHERRRARH